MEEDDNDQSAVNSIGDEKENLKQKNRQAKDKINQNKGVQFAKKSLKNFILAHLSQVCFFVGIIVLSLIIIGIIQALLSMPGMVLGKLKEFGQYMLSQIVGFFTGDTVTTRIDGEDVIDIAQYIQDMGYDIEGYGFGKVEYEEDEDTTDKVGIDNSNIKNIDDINGKNYLLEYLVQDQAIYTPTTWSWKGFFEDGPFHQGRVSDSSIGMINIDEDEYKPIFDYLGIGGISIGNWRDIWNVMAETYKIDPKTRTLRVKTGQGLFQPSEYVYFNMANWTSKYGKPLELFLALHLSTMMPDLTYDLATAKVFNTKVNISTDRTKYTYTVSYQGTQVTPSNVESIADSIAGGDDYRKEKIQKALEDLMDDGVNDSNYIRYPRITSVTHHWFYNDFEFNYEKAEEVHKTMNYTPVDSYNALYGVDGITLDAMISDGYYQTVEPEPEGPNEAIVALFKGGKGNIDGDDYDFSGEYYRYDGTRATAEKIENGSSEVSKEPVTFIDSHNNNSHKNAFAAFAILQNSDTEEAEECYRCLKKLLIELDYFTEDELKDVFQQVLTWFMPDNMEEENIIKDTNQYGIIVKDSMGKTIKAPGDGEITAVNKDTITIKFSKLNSEKFNELQEKYGDEYNVQDNVVVDMEMVIKGIEPSVTKGQNVSAGDELGKASVDEVQVYMKNMDGSIVDDVQTYMDISTPWSSSEQNLSNATSGDHDVHDKALFVTKEQFKRMIESADRTIVSQDGKENILDNTDAFIKIQDDYQVNALFAACVTIAESGGGVGWDLIDSNTHNWFSIMGNYHGRKFTDRNGTNWKYYPSFAAAVDDFGHLMTTSAYYGSGNYTVSEIGKVYSGSSSGRWPDTVNGRMSDFYEKIK